ncbi:MAG: hypothetical protein Q9191_007999 [Dirinaria sp. TL-2023a]
MNIRYLTSFAVKRDFFHSFFGSEEDDLDQNSHSAILRNELAKNEERDDVIKNDNVKTFNEEMNVIINNRNDEDIQMTNSHLSTLRDSTNTFNEGMNVSIDNQDNKDIQMTNRHSLTLKDSTNTEKENESQLQSSQSQPLSLTLNQQNHDDVVSFAETSRLLSETSRDMRKKSSFIVLSLMIDNTFCKRYADSLDKTSMVTALELSSKARFVALDNSKRLKMTSSIAILDAARSEQLQTVLKIKDSNVETVIRQFEDHTKFEDELDMIT